MDEKLLAARVKDTYTAAERGSQPSFLGFLTSNEAARCAELLRGCRYELFGGFEGAERIYLCCKPDWCDEVEFPIIPLTLSYRKCDKLTHRDFLGALMALGLTREAIGDILVEDGRAVIFVAKSIAPFITTQLEKVGRVGIDIKQGFSAPLPQLGCVVECSGTVASNRLDCIVGEIIGLSRSGAVKLIEDGLVSVNLVASLKPVRAVREGDRITVRGKGRFTVTSVTDTTKKGRLILKYTKFV